MSKKISFIIICLAFLSAPLLAQAVKEYTLADDAMYYFFDSRVVSAPTHNYAVVFFNYVGNPVANSVGKEYIKSLVVGKAGRPNKATVLAEAEWIYDGGAPANARNNYRSPRLIDVIWNADREGFDLFLMTTTPWKPGVAQKTILWIMPLDDRGKQIGRKYRIRDYDGNGDYYDFQKSRQFISGPEDRRILMTRNDETGNVRLHMFNKRGKKLIIKDDVLGNSTNPAQRYPLAIANYGPDRLCIYSDNLNPDTFERRVHVEVFDAYTLEKLSGAKNFTINSDAYYATFAGNSHLFYSSVFMSDAQQYEVTFQTIGAKKKPMSPKKSLPGGNVLAVQNIAARPGSDAAFNLFTIVERHFPEKDTFYLTRIDSNGNVVSETQKLIEAVTGIEAYQPKPYVISETANGNVILLYRHQMFVYKPEK